MVKKTPPAAASAEVDPLAKIAQLKATLQEQADVAAIWQEKWQTSENDGITKSREIKRLQREVQNLQSQKPVPKPDVPPPSNDETP